MIPFSRALGGEVFRFGIVGVGATLAHVGATLALDALFAIYPLLANFLGFLCGATVSYIGHSQFTFGVNSEHGFQVPRFAVVSLTALAVSSALTWVVCDLFGGPIGLAMALMVVAVPAMTFLGMKLWVFTAGRRAT